MSNKKKEKTNMDTTLSIMQSGFLELTPFTVDQKMKII